MGVVKRIINHAIPPGTRRRLFVRLLVSRRYWIGLLGFVGLMIARRFVDLRVGLISADRIGHFVPDVLIRFAEESPQGRPGKTIYWVEGQVSNTFWFEVMKRNLTCHPIAKYIGHLAPFIPKSENWFLSSPRWTARSRDVDGLTHRTGARPAFLPRENQFARTWLKSIGWVEGQPLVCVLVRDSKFLNTEPGRTPADHGLEPNAWSYHNYRDSDIQTFVPAMEWLAEQGAFVLRMGKKMDSPLRSIQPNIIDYAFHPEKSDFLDVWLFANCDLCITTGTGPDLISVLYGRPVLCVNYLPISQAITVGRVTTAGKRLYDSFGNRLTLEENLAAHFFRTVDYRDAGIEIRDLESAAVTEIVKEKWLCLNDSASIRCPDEKLRTRFIELLRVSPGANTHGWIHPEANLSRAWFEQLQEEAEPR